ncbi:hypothetical protein SSPIM334S_04252 [Streptomyces spiroverticillatus]
MTTAEEARSDWRERIHKPSGDVAAVAEVALAAPQGLRMRAGAGHVTLEWEPVDGAIGYLVHKAVGGGEFVTTKQRDVDVPQVPSPRFVDTALVPGETVRYVVAAVAGMDVTGPFCAPIAAAAAVVPSVPPKVSVSVRADVRAGPIALARAQRAHTARVLLQTTPLPVTDIAFAAGFASVRQFNDTVRKIYARTPSELRAERGARPAEGTSAPSAPAHPLLAGIPLRLAYRGPYAARETFDLLAAEAVPRIEEVVGEPGTRTYRRTLRLPHGTGTVSVDEAPRPGWLDARISLSDLRDLTTAVQRLRRLFDLDADPYAVDERLGSDPRLTRLVEARPGLRSPGAADPDECAVRLRIGRERATALVEAYGEAHPHPCGTLDLLFPAPDALTGEPDAGPLATALALGTVRLDPGADREETARALAAIPDLDARTAALIRMRALGDPDVTLPESPDEEAWRPWRSYATRHLALREGAPSTQSSPR